MITGVPKGKRGGLRGAGVAEDTKIAITCRTLPGYGRQYRETVSKNQHSTAHCDADVLQ